MTTLEQALHIFRKDVRHLRLEIGAALFFTLVLVIAGIQSWENLQERGPGFGDDTPLSVLLPLVWGLLIARAIQSEALPGDRHFWLTRPYSRAGLVLGKLLLIAAFIHLPLLAAQAVIVLADGLPLPVTGLLWNQLLLAVIFVLPVTAIATLTRNLAQFLPAAVISVVPMIAVIEESRRPESAWVRLLLAIILLTAIGCFVVWRQYRLRRSANTALLAFGAGVASLILSASFPNQAVFAIQSSLIGTQDKQFGLKLSAPEPKTAGKGPARTPNRFRQTVKFPILVEGATSKDLMVQGWDLSFKTLSGVTRHADTKIEFSPTGLVQFASVDREFYEAAKNSPVTLRVTYALTQFGDGASAEVPLDGTPVFLPGVGQCGAAVSWDHREFICRSPFRTPGMFSSDRVQAIGGGMRQYTPFHLAAQLHPMITQRYGFPEEVAKELAPAAPEVPVKLTARERVAYFRYTLEAANVRLADYAVDAPVEDQ